MQGLLESVTGMGETVNRILVSMKGMLVCMTGLEAGSEAGSEAGAGAEGSVPPHRSADGARL